MSSIDRPGLAGFLRRARAAAEPVDVVDDGRRRVTGLRREEVASRAGISTDYYKRLEQARGSTPTASVAASLARALHLDPDETDHLHRMVGAPVPERTPSNASTSVVLQALLDHLDDTPACIITDLGEVLAQNRLGTMLIGPQRAPGRGRNTTWRWFTDPTTRWRHPVEDHAQVSRTYVADLRATASRRRGHPDVEELVRDLRAASPEFARLWDEQHVRVRSFDRKRLRHPEVGVLHIDCRWAVDPATGQRLLVFGPTPGSGAEDQFRLLAALPDSYLDAAPDAGETGVTSPAGGVDVNV
ncbi:helix-turn-helix transcriptional regulator [Jatrophihabitans sp. YIM 134969]